MYHRYALVGVGATTRKQHFPLSLDGPYSLVYPYSGRRWPKLKRAVTRYAPMYLYADSGSSPLLVGHHYFSQFCHACCVRACEPCESEVHEINEK